MTTTTLAKLVDEYGTLRTGDLIQALADELDRIETDRYFLPEHRAAMAEARAALTLEAAGWDVMDSELACDLLNRLIDALGEHAPPYGSHSVTNSDY